MIDAAGRSAGRPVLQFLPRTAEEIDWLEEEIAFVGFA
jgi:hypothetical protein